MGALETVLVGIIVAASAIFSVWRLMPNRYRLRFVQRLSNKVNAGHGGALLARLERTVRTDLAHSSCGQCSANVPAKAQSSRTRSSHGRARHQKPAAPLR
jgi:hypothetical protein